MKKLTKVISALAFISALALVGCADPNKGPSTDSTTPPQKPDTSVEDKATVKKAAENLVIIDAVLPNDTSIDLPSMTAVGEKAVNVTWTSSDDKVIKISSGSYPTVTHKTETVTVKLTATLSCEGQTETKDFNVKVYGTGTDINIDDADILKNAVNNDVESLIKTTETKENVEINLSTKFKSSQDNTKPDYSKITITWKLLGNDANVKLENNVITAKKTNKVYTVNYQATLTLNEATQTKDFTASINKLPNRFYEGLDNKSSLSIYDDYLELIGPYSSRYSYKEEGGFLYLKKQAGDVQTASGAMQWMTPEEYKKTISNTMNLDALLPAAKTLEEDPTIENLTKFSNNLPEMGLPKDPYELLINMKAYEDTSINSVEKAKAATPEVTKAAVVKCIPLLKGQFAYMAQMSEEEATKTTLVSILEQSKNVMLEMNGFGAKDLEEFKTKLVEKDGKATLNAVFESNKPFEKQRGKYTNDTVKLSVYYISPKTGILGINSEYGDTVRFNDNFTKFKVVRQGETKDSFDWTLSYTQTTGDVTITNTDGTKYDLTFSPKCLFQSK